MSEGPSWEHLIAVVREKAPSTWVEVEAYVQAPADETEQRAGVVFVVRGSGDDEPQLMLVDLRRDDTWPIDVPLRGFLGRAGTGSHSLSVMPKHAVPEREWLEFARAVGRATEPQPPEESP